METAISSKKAAEYFKVNESTVKRWADSGILKCYKTAGGHRKFRLEDLKNYADANDHQTVSLVNIEKGTDRKQILKERKYSQLCSRLEKIILKGNSKSAFEFLYTLYFNNYSLEEIFDEIIRDVMSGIGSKWESKELGIESEHIATNTLVSALQKFETVINKKKKIKRSAVCAGPDNEFHEIGLICVKIALESEGWNVIYPGINLPFGSLNELVRKIKPDLVCLTAANIGNKKNYEKQLGVLIKNTELSGGKVLLGGSNFKTEKYSKLKCDTISDLNKQLTKL